MADIRTGSVLDPSNQQLGLLLSHLYPRELPPSEVWDYLREDPLKRPEYVRFWQCELLDQSSDEEVAELLDSFQVRRIALRPVLNSYLFRGLPGRLLSRGLEKHGHELEPERLYDWLSVGSEQSISAHDKESVDYIRSWLEGRPETQKAIVMEGLLRCPESDEFWRHSFNVLKRWYSSSPPSDFGLWCLEQAAAVADDRPLVAEQLLEWSFKAHRNHAGNAGLSLEVLQEWTQKKARLRERLDQLLSPSPALKVVPRRMRSRGDGKRRRNGSSGLIMSGPVRQRYLRTELRLVCYMTWRSCTSDRKPLKSGSEGDRGLIDAVLRGPPWHDRTEGCSRTGGDSTAQRAERNALSRPAFLGWNRRGRERDRRVPMGRRPSPQSDSIPLQLDPLESQTQMVSPASCRATGDRRGGARAVRRFWISQGP